MKILSAIFFFCAGLCIAYFGVILSYSGFSTSLCWVWVIFALIFISMGVFLRNGVRRKDELPGFLPTFIYSSFGLLLVGIAVIMSLVIGASNGSSDRKVDYCVVMGARVYPGGISKTLMYRLDEACELYKENPSTVFVLAGGQDKGDAIPEAFAMYNYLNMKGLPGEVLLMEPHRTTTTGILQSAAMAIKADSDNRKIPKGPGDSVWAEDYEPRVGIITSDFHMFRSLVIAKEQGITNLAAIPAKSDSVLFVHNCVRECAAIVKDFLMGNVTVDESHMPEIPFNRNKRN